MISFDWHVGELLITEDHPKGQEAQSSHPGTEGTSTFCHSYYPFKVRNFCLEEMHLPCSCFKSILLLLNFVETKGNSNISLEDCPLPYRGRGQYL